MACVASLVTTPSALAASPGDLDPSFGSSGTFLQQFGAASSQPYSEAWAVAEQPDGKVVFAGDANSSGTPSRNQVLVGRLNSDGTLDQSFASGGRLIDQLGVTATPSSGAEGVAIEPDGKIVFTGSATDPNGKTEVLVGRLNPDGSLDPTFGSGGVFLDQVGAGSNKFSRVEFGSILFQSGKVLVGGDATDASGREQVMVLRLNSDGSLDSSFGSAGEFLHQFASGTSPTSRVTALAFQSDGKLLVGGDAYDNSQTKVLIARLSPDGALDTSFGSSGVVLKQLGAGTTNPFSSIFGIAQRPDGKIITAGGLSDGTGAELAMVAQFNSDGSLDTSFGSGGTGSHQFGSQYTVPPSTTPNPAYSYNFGFAVQPNGKVVTGVGASGGTWAPMVARWNTDGSLDPSFGSGGAVQSAQPGGSNPSSTDADGIALQSDGKILAAGEVTDSTGNQVFVSRLTGDLAPTASFTISPSAVQVGRPVAFNGTASSDPDGTIASYRWDFGDGTTGTGATAAHPYGKPGTYTVKLTVTDDDGFTAATAHPVTVTAAPPPPRLTHVLQSHRRWRRGNGLPHIARKRRPPVGTRFGFTLNESARMTFAFTQRLPGRKVGRRCVAQTRRNRAKRRCTRTVTAGVLRFTGHAGANSLRFAGRISRGRKLRPGTYALVITATSPTGQRATARLKFTIVKG